MGDLPALALALPLIAAALVSALGHLMKGWLVNAAAVATMIATAATCVLLAAHTPGSPVPYWVAGWGVREGTPLGICLAIDPAAAWTAALSAALTAVVLIFSAGYFEQVRKHYAPLVMLLGSGMIGFAFAGDLFTLFVFLEVMSNSAYALSAHKTEEPDAIQGGLAFAVTNTIGGLLFVMGVALIYAHTGTLNLAAAGEAISSADPSNVPLVAFALMAAGLLTKGGIVPFHFWIGDAYASAPSPVAALFAGVLTEVPIYAIARVRFVAFGHGPAGVELLLCVLGCTTALVCAVMAVRQSNLKRMLAFIVSSHAGILLVGIALAKHEAVMGAAIYLAAHVALNSGLLLAAGAVLNRLGSVDTRALRCKGRGMWLFPLVLGMGALGLAGAPPFGTFRGKAAIEKAAAHAGYEVVPWVLAIAAGLTAAALLRAVLVIFTKLGERAEDERAGEDKPQADPEPEDSSPKLLGSVAAVLVLGSLVVGLATPALAEADRAARALLTGELYREAVLNDVRERLPAHAPAWPSAKEHAFAFLALAIGVVGALSRFLRGPVRSVRRALTRMIGPLERVHDGRLGAYVAWMMVGTAAVGWFLLAASIGG